jgi:hypothetical protein
MNTPNSENPFLRERTKREVRFYIMFTSPEERNKAKTVLDALLKEDREQGIYQIPAGPDYPLTQKNILNAEYKESHDDENPEKTDVGLEISFTHTPDYFKTPEALELFLITELKKRNLHINKKDGHDEVYEVVGNEPQEFTPPN